MRKEEYSLLSDFLYEAIYIPDGTAAPPKSVITCPELQVYIADFGNSKHDKALIVEGDGNIVGAIWARIRNDYGPVSYTHLNKTALPFSPLILWIWRLTSAMRLCCLITANWRSWRKPIWTAGNLRIKSLRHSGRKEMNKTVSYTHLHINNDDTM